jgi:REP element-mobilizing transposase RayT
MARKLRVKYEGAIYHVMNRWDRREPVFKDDQDRLLFMETLGQACRKRDWQVQAWCLMGNHFHLVVETPQGQYRKGDQRKVRIARRLRQETTMTLKWIADRLKMGTGTHVTNRLYHLKK